MPEEPSKLNWKHKTLIVGLVILLFVTVFFLVKYKQDADKKQDAINKSNVEMKHLQDEIVRASAQYATKKDVENLAKANGVDLDPIKKDLKDLNAEIKGVGTVLAKTPGQHVTYVSSTTTEPVKNPVTSKCPDGTECPDTFGYIKNTQKLELEEPLSNNKKVPFGKVAFTYRDKPWDVDVYPRSYNVTTVLSEDENGRHFVHNKFSVETQGKRYDVPITEAKFLEQYPDSSFNWNPKLLMSASLGPIMTPPMHLEFVPALEMSLFSYGKTKVNPDWLFVAVGPGYETQEKAVNLMLTPVAYNLGSAGIPMIHNLYLAPSVSLDFSGNIGIYGSILVGL